MSHAPSRVLSGHIKSCGCLRKTSKATHGVADDPFYHTWWSMMQRCYNPNHHQFKNYGARGIKVCEPWHDPINFINWAKSTIGNKVKSLSIDRIDTHGNYDPENCRWATAKQQANNRTNNTCYSIDGVTKTFTEWCNLYNISDNVAWERINKLNWSPKEAFSTPLHSTSKRYRLIEINGITKSVAEWCRIYKIQYNTVYARIKRGLSYKDAITLPINKK